MTAKKTTTAQELWALDGADAYMATADLMVGGRGVVELVIPTFVITHDKGLVLIDTGLDPEAFQEGGESVYAFARALFIPRCAPGNSVIDQLAARGVAPADIAHVVLTHDHFDHTGGLHFFPDAVTHIGAADLAHARAVQAGTEEDHIIRPVDFQRAQANTWEPMTGDIDLFGDGSVILLTVPGHTGGNYAVLVRLPTRTILLTGDTAHLREQFDNEIAMPTDLDPVQAVQSMRRLKEIAVVNDAEVWIGHDSDDWARFGAPGTFL